MKKTGNKRLKKNDQIFDSKIICQCWSGSHWTFFIRRKLVRARPVQADQMTLPAHVHLGYVTEEELTAEEKSTGDSYNPEAYQNEDTFYLVYKKKELSRFFLKQEVREVALFGLSLATASFAVLLLSKSTGRRSWASF